MGNDLRKDGRGREVNLEIVTVSSNLDLSPPARVSFFDNSTGASFFPENDAKQKRTWCSQKVDCVPLVQASEIKL